MMILRLTTKAFQKFCQKPKLVEVDKTEGDFGEWYVNTVDSVNQGNLCVVVMHAKSLYAMLLSIEDVTQVNKFIHSIYAAVLIRMLRLEIPKENAERVMASYGNNVILSKTNSRSLTANLSTIIKEINAIMEWPVDIVKGYSNILDLDKLENQINDVPRTLNKRTIWPLKAFYNCIRKLCPELPARQPLPLDFYSRTSPCELARLFEDNVSEHLALKAKASMAKGEVLFTVEEISALLKAVDNAGKGSYDITAQTYSDLKHVLRFKIQQLEAHEKDF